MGTMPRGWEDGYIEGNDKFVTIHIGNAIRLESNESCYVRYHNLTNRPYRMVVTVHNVMLYNKWVYPDKSFKMKVTNPAAYGSAVFSHVDKGNLIDRVRFCLTGDV